jgi:putative flippase GtrA
MSAMGKTKASRSAEVVRFLLNGVFATAVHYGVLTLNVEVLGISPVGLANFVAAWFGITASFLGSRWFVFQNVDAPVMQQAVRFVSLYALIACLHGIVLYLWSDRAGWNYSAGFLVATGLQTVLSYLGNRFLVFKNA